MLKNILKVCRRIIFSSFLLYGYNLIVSPINLYIPINFITILSISIFGIPALLSFIIVFIVVF